MMTVFRLFRKQTSAPALPRWIRLTGEPTAPGGAKPGRGGRRKRKADRTIIRKHIGSAVERRGWPLLWELRILLLSRMPTRFTRKLALAPLLMPPAGLAARLERKTLGRRERRRRAKLRRRRARALEKWHREERDRAPSVYLRNLDASQTPGA